MSRPGPKAGSISYTNEPVDNYICACCKAAWTQPTGEVPRYPKCPPYPTVIEPSGLKPGETRSARIDAYGKPAFQQIEELLDDGSNKTKADLTLREYTSAERKQMPVTTGVLHYFPDAIAAISRVSKKGNDKHNPGEPLHWSREKSSDHDDCVGRHLLTPDAIDPDSGETERAHRAWRDLADLQLAEEKRLIAAGIKPLSGVVK
jgi:hypothetical protein